MFELLIDKDIGSDYFSEGITPDYVRRTLATVAPNEDVRITINSLGGSIWDCIAIYNIIRDFARCKKNKITTYIQGIAASAASVIALAAHDVSVENKIIVEDNSIFMIHNGWCMVVGNKNDMRAAADSLEPMDNMMADCYARCTKKSSAKIKKMMDDETWLYGQEIVDNGFANEVIKNNTDDTTDFAALKSNGVASAKAQIVNMQEHIKAMNAKEFVSKIAACAVLSSTGIPGGNKPDSTPENGDNLEGCTMTAIELKKSNPDIYAEIAAEGEKSGTEKERARVDSLLKMGELAGCPDVAAGFIRDGAAVADNKVQETFFEKRIAKAAVNKQAEDEKNIPNIVPPKDNGAADDAAVMAAFNKETGAK